jgi:hypothetical protein
MTEILSKEKNVSTNDDNDQEYKKRLMNFLERTDRFAAPDQLPYLKPFHIVPNLSNNPNSLNNYKRQYCEQWLMEQNQIRVISHRCTVILRRR